MEQDVRYLVVGAGDRGRGYARIARGLGGRARVVGVAEPRDERRERFAAENGVPADAVFRDWREAAARPRFADAVIVATQDRMHADPAVAFAGLGYALLLEKPMADNLDDCRRIVEAVKASGAIFAVCHVLRYTAYTRRLKALLDAGAVGDLVSVQHLEPVAPWHQAHSFVRGNWRNAAQSSPMLLAKSCHDLDWIRHLLGVPCRSVSSFGSLHHFRPECRPPGAADRCLECGVEADCPYSARRIYLGRVRQGRTGWPVSVVADPATEASIEAALRTGPYGRCVYACDNDVVDHQVVAMEFAGGRSAVFTMTAFAGSHYGRTTRLFGTRGELWGDSRHIEHHDFLTDRVERIDTAASDGTISGGHGGGDEGIVRAFTAAVASGDRRLVLTDADETFESHRIVFAAERARTERRVVPLDEVR